MDKRVHCWTSEGSQYILWVVEARYRRSWGRKGVGVEGGVRGGEGYVEVERGWRFMARRILGRLNQNGVERNEERSGRARTDKGGAAKESQALQFGRFICVSKGGTTNTQVYLIRVIGARTLERNDVGTPMPSSRTSLNVEEFSHHEMEGCKSLRFPPCSSWS